MRHNPCALAVSSILFVVRQQRRPRVPVKFTLFYPLWREKKLKETPLGHPVVAQVSSVFMPPGQDKKLEAFV